MDSQLNSIADRPTGLHDADCLMGGGEAGAHMRAHDWSATSVGPVSQWPLSLQAAVGICLNSRVPSAIWWGREHLTAFYNDTYQIILRRADGLTSLGRPCRDRWADNEEIFRPVIDRVFSSGAGECLEDQLVVVDRTLREEEAYFTFSFSPIHVPPGNVGGIFCSGVETTSRVIAERRLKALRDLGASAAAFQSIAAVCDSAARIMGENSHDTCFCLIYLLEGDGNRARLMAAFGVDPGSDLAPRLIEFTGKSENWPPADICRGIRTELMWKLGDKAGQRQCDGRHGMADVALVLPIVARGRARRAGVMISGISPGCVADDNYRDFLNVAAGQIAAAIAFSAPADATLSGIPNRTAIAVRQNIDGSNDTTISPLDDRTIESQHLEVCARLEFLRREAEQALRESEERFARFMRHLPGLAWIKDHQGRYVYANESAESAFRTYRQDLYGKNDDEIFPPQVAAQFRENDLRALASEGGIHTVEKLEHEDGIIHHSIVSKFPIPGWDDKPALIGGIAVDITDLIRAEEQIRENEKRFRRLAEAMPQMVFMTNSDGEVEYFNQRWHDFTGLSQADEASIKEVVHPDDYSLLMSRWRDASAREEPFEAQIRIKGALDGVYRWFLSRALPIGGAQGNVTQWFGTFTDIDSQKRVEQGQHVLAEVGRLLTSSLGYHATLASICGLAVPALADWCSLELLNDDGQVEYLRVAHADRAKVELAHEYRRMYPPRHDDQSGLMKVFRTGEPEFWQEVTDEQLVVRARDDEELRLLRALGTKSVMIVPLSARGRNSGALTLVLSESSRLYGEDDLRLAVEIGSRAGLAVDNARLWEETRKAVHERELALQLHCEIEKQLTLLVEASGSLSASLDLVSVSSAIMALSRRLVAADAYAVWQYESLSGYWRIAHASGLSEQYEQSAIHVSEHLPGFLDEPIIAEDITTAAIVAHRRPAYEREGVKSLLIVPLRVRGDRNGSIAFYYRVPHKFTEVEVRVATALSNLCSAAIGSAQLYEELRTNDRRKDEFLAMLAHELRNPLAAIDSAVTLLGVADPGRDQLDWSVDVIGRHVKHLTRLIDDLLDVSRITRGKIQLRKMKIDAYPVLNSAIESVRPLLEERKHRLSTSYGTDLILDSDPTRLEQIAVNLLLNAAKYTEIGGRIWFSAQHDGNEIVIRVRDNGVGIPAEQLSSIFDLFVQGERSLDRSAGGLGIGLTLVKTLAELHGGTVVAQSEGSGKGSEFIVRLPAAPAGVIRQSGPRAKLEPPSSQAARILVVDDNTDLARGLARLLEFHGHKVSIAYDGPSGFLRAKEWRPEFVLLDIGLPGMDGYQVAALLRQDDDTKDTIIIGISGYGQEDDRKRSTQAGFDRHLVKPISSQDLLKLLANPR
jgi:PAS domain S-box-containing protein